MRLNNSTEITERLKAILFAGGAHMYAVLDGASVEGLLEHLYDGPLPFECLYRGELAPDLAEVAPYLVKLEPRAPLTAWIIGQGWGNHWGIFVSSKADLAEVRRHFRRFLIVHDPEGRPMYFRFYDPRVLRVFLPTCEGGELKSFFGPVACYFAEQEDAAAIYSFELADGALTTRSTALSPDAGGAA